MTEKRGRQPHGSAEESRLDHWDWGRKGDELRGRRRWREALACYEKALRLNPLDTVSRDAYLSDLNGKQECLSHLGRATEASRCAEQAKQLRASLRATKKR